MVEAGVDAENAPVAGNPSASGNVLSNDSDPDAGDTITVISAQVGESAPIEVGESTPITGIYGTLTIAANGNWTYALNNADADTNALAQGASASDVFSYTIQDNNGATSTATLTIPITGTNDAPVAVADTSTGAAVVEAGVDAENAPVAGNPSASGNVLSNDSDPDAGDTITVISAQVGESAPIEVGKSTPITGIYGTLTIAANGNWTYALNNADADTNALAQGASASDVFSYTIQDNNGATSTATLTIPITGTNDAPVAVADTNTGAAVVEAGVDAENAPVAGNPSASGNVLSNDSDPDAGDTITVISAQVGESAPIEVGESTPITGIYGTLTIAANGNWTYALNNADADTNALAQGASASDVFSYTIQDNNGATSTATLTIPITGTNDAPVAVADTNTGAAVVEAGVDAENAPVAGNPSASGNVLSNDSDPDAGDTITVISAQVGESAPIEVGKSTPITGIYGTLTIAANGNWTYALNNADADTNALAQGASASDVFSYTIQDNNGATSTATLTIPITGTNDAPVAVADTNTGAAVVEAGVDAENAPVAGNPSASGNVLSNDSDPDAGDTITVISAQVGESAPIEVGELTPITGIYGTLTIAANGNWTYALNNADADTNALAQGASASDVFSYTIQDNNGATSTATLTIPITGTNDAPVAVADTNTGAAVVEAGVDAENAPVAGNPSASGNVLSNDSDPDAGDTITVISAQVGESAPIEVGESTPITGIYGTLTIAANGNWTYALNNADADTNALAQGASASDVFSYTIQDNNGATSTATLTIPITGTNDAPVAVADTNTGAAVVEAGVDAENAPVAGNPSASGNVLSNDSDPDAGDTITVISAQVGESAPIEVGESTPITGIYGTLTIAANGNWTYALNNADADTNALAQGASASDVFSYTIQDNNGATSTATLTIPITGTNDAPVATNLTQTLAYTEGAASVPINDIVVSDVDNGDTITATLTLANPAAGTLTTSGTATYTPGTGVWTITGTVAQVNAALAAVAFTPATNNDLDTTITTHIQDAAGTGPADGTITLDVTGVNEAPVVVSGATLNYTENDAPTAISPAATVADIDSTDFNGGSLTVSFTANGTADDQLTIQNQGTGVGQIGVQRQQRHVWRHHDRHV